MPNEVGTEATRSDAPSVDDALFGDAADDKPAAPVEGEDSDAEKGPEQQDVGDANEQDGDNAEQDAQGSGDAGDQVAPTDDLKVVLSIKGARATIGVQRPSADPHIETFDDADLPGLAQEVPAVTERARARWEETPKHPAYERPATPARRRNRRQQGTAEASDAETETDQAQQTLRLF